MMLMQLASIVAAILDRGLDAFAAFLHGIVGESHDVEVLHTRGADVDFDFDRVGVNAVHRGADCFEEHGKAEGASLFRAYIN